MLGTASWQPQAAAGFYLPIHFPFASPLRSFSSVSLNYLSFLRSALFSNPLLIFPCCYLTKNRPLFSILSTSFTEHLKGLPNPHNLTICQLLMQRCYHVLSCCFAQAIKVEVVFISWDRIPPRCRVTLPMTDSPGSGLLF